MTESQLIGIIAMSVIFVLLAVLVYCSNNYSLNGIKKKTVGQGQYGTARFSTKAEVKKTYIQIPFDVRNWRKGKNLPTVQGTVVGCRTHGKKTVSVILSISDFVGFLCFSSAILKNSDFSHAEIFSICLPFK